MHRLVSFPVGRPALGGVIDIVQVDPVGIIKVVGWSGNEIDSHEIPELFLDATPVPFLQHYRFPREDIVHRKHSRFTQAGFILEYLVPESMLSGAKTLDLKLHKSSLRFQAELAFVRAHYTQLLNTSEVLHRDQIYGSGLPNPSVHPEILVLAGELEGPLLDFGCGRGALIEVVRKRGVDAYGIELDCPIIRRFLTPELSPFITLYNGHFPSPFNDGQFRSVMCSEVLEHIPDYEQALLEIGRLCTEKAIITVPDASAIPIGFRHASVPWHLLESTHVNFFTQQSLGKALHSHFRRIEFGRVGAANFNDSPFFTSIVATCWK